jgi:hypothetical protein
LNTSHGATFFLGVSESRLNINTSALLFFVPGRSVNHACIGGGSWLYQVGRVRILKRSILRDAVQANPCHRLCFVVAQEAGIAGFIATAQQKVQVVRFAHWDAHKAARPITKMLCFSVYRSNNVSRLAIIAWIVSVLLLTYVGYILLWHGAVYLDSTNRAGEFNSIYFGEVVVGSIMLWPVVLYGWITHLLTGSKQAASLSILLVLQGCGYFALFWIYQKMNSKKT